LAKYTSRKFTHFVTCLRRTWSYVCLFHNWTHRIHYGMASNGWCWYRLGKYFIYTYAMLSGSLPSLTKWAITWEFSTSLS
jgi:hypothetical protein